MKRSLTPLAAVLALGISFQADAVDLAAGEAKAKEVCAACHGADGNSTDVNNPRLAGQHRDYIAKALRDYQSGARENAIMKGFASPLSKQEIENLAAYFSSQKSVLGVKY